MRQWARGITVGVSLLLVGCGREEGVVDVRVAGGTFIENGLSASDVDDGWSLDFERFAVTLENIGIAGELLPNPGERDLAQPSEGRGQELGAVAVEADDYGNPGFTVRVLDLSGTATKEGQTKAFSWRFERPTQYFRCGTVTRVPPGGTASFQIGFAAERLLANSLVANTPRYRFQPLADADVDGDGTLTQAELVLRGLGDYDPGEEDITELWGWLEAQVRRMVRVDGEGECEIRDSGG